MDEAPWLPQPSLVQISDRMLKSPLLLVFVSLALASCQVVDITQDTFDTLVKNGTWMVDIYAPW